MNEMVALTCIPSSAKARLLGIRHTNAKLIDYVKIPNIICYGKTCDELYKCMLNTNEKVVITITSDKYFVMERW